MRSNLLFLVLAPTLLSAQHCGFDHSSIIVVRPMAAQDSTVIDGLRIILLDSNNLPFVNYDRPWYLFHRNTDPAGCDEHPFGTFHGSACCFPFAQDNYVLVIPSGLRTQGMKVLVQDERNGGSGELKRTVVPITDNNVYILCGTFDEEVYPPLTGRPNFAPMDIILYPR